MISDTIDLRPRYNEVDRMGYVYHANYITYCHIGRTELLRKFGINDKELEDHNIMLPVIDMHIQYKKPAFYDETLIVNTQVKELKASRCIFNFEIENKTK
jgi:acyl-CoA thioester hydrolase